jgi:hypothetical protein
MGHTARAFFDNGGTKAYIVRLAGEGRAAASAKLIVPLGSAATVADINKYLNIQAANPGVWANGLELRAVESQPAPRRYTVSVGRTDSRGTFAPSEVFTDVSLNPDDAADFVATKVNGVSPSIKIEPVTLGDIPAAEKTPHMIGSLTSGDLSGLTASQIAALNGKGFEVTLEPGNKTATVVLASPTCARPRRPPTIRTRACCSPAGSREDGWCCDPACRPRPHRLRWRHPPTRRTTRAPP